jgi:uncharacterized membrane protein
MEGTMEVVVVALVMFAIILVKEYLHQKHNQFHMTQIQELINKLMSKDFRDYTNNKVNETTAEVTTAAALQEMADGVDERKHAEEHGMII